MPEPRPDVPPATTRGNLFDNIRVWHGPVDVIRRFLRLGEQEALRRGLSLSFATFDELLTVNEQNRDSWKPLVGVFDPRLNMLEPSSSYCILGRNELGEVVSTQAARLYDWRQTNFHDEATSLRFIYKTLNKTNGREKASGLLRKGPGASGDGSSSRVPAGIAVITATPGYRLSCPAYHAPVL
jgi:hypothetical protein